MGGKKKKTREKLLLIFYSFTETKNVAKKGKGEGKRVRFVVDCSVPVADNILETAALEKYLHDKMKVDGRTGNFGNNVKVTRDSDNNK